MLAGNITTPPHRTYDTAVGKSSTATHGLPLTPKLNRTDILVGGSVVCGGALVGDSLDDEEWSDNLLATGIRQPRGTHCEGSRSSTNLSLIENWPEDLRTPTICDRQHKIWQKSDGVKCAGFDECGDDGLVQSTDPSCDPHGTLNPFGVQNEPYNDHKREEDI